ncbi:MAG: hypothetical protein LBH43_16915 [Treponema sp.]|nr:hypothetical protein [Treponema sp.]
MNIGERRNLAESEFYDLADRASSSAVFLGFMTEPYQETLKDFISTSETLLGIIITGSSGEYAFERQTGSGIVWAGNSPRLKTGIGLLGEPFYLPLRIEGQRNVTIQAVYSQIDYYLFQTALKNTLLAVLAALIIAFVTLLIELSQKKKSVPYKYAVNDESEEAKPKTRGNLQAASFREEEKPQGLYNPRGNIGWDSYTQDRLASELHRCSSFEQDLVFLAIEFKGAQKTSDSVYCKFTDEAVNFFTMRDLIFGKGENGITVIMPNTDLEHGITKSEEFRSRIITKLSESFGSRHELCIGLSSRSGRLIEAERLIMEAFSALKRALKDPVTHVVAFKSDPEKYREFIKQSGRNS